MRPRICSVNSSASTRVLHRNLGLITCRAGALDFLVAPDACQRAIRAHELTLAAEIAPPQNKLNQLAHRNRVDGF